MSQVIRYSRFEVLQHPDGSPHVLGEDTDATIFLAREKETGAPAVLRVPGPGVQRNPSARHRFLEEAREMAQVHHPHLVAVLHSGDTSAGAFCAMEFCDGLTLQKAIEEVGALPWQEAFRLALQLAGLLEALDRHGLVHRGLRSTNIMVTTGADGHAHLKVTEYGRVSEDTIRDTIAATKSGFIRVPAYASPEEFLAVAPPDARSLQYALGAVLWFCLTAKPIFEGSQFEVMFQHVNKEPDWKKLPPLPKPVLAVLKLMLAKSASDRFASPAALASALRSATEGVAEPLKKAATLDAPATGPTALAWLKARQTLLLDEVHPLLAQIAELMDTAMTSGAGMLDASLERVLIEIDGWPALPENQRAALLRTPIVGWPLWRIKLFPLNAANATDRPASQAAAFVRLCHRLLTGQGKGAGKHVPTAALTAEGNAFFEKHLASGALLGVSCRGLFDLLCEAEEVMASSGDLLGGADPLATRVVHARPESAPESVAAEKKHQAWIAREREALERARQDLSAQEAERARRMAEEQAHVEKLRRSLEEQKAQLEEKRREQQRLEQELQLRAQLEFQKLQEEAKARESVLQHKRAAAEEALRQREEEFRLREQERFARLEKLKHENDAMEERVQQEYLTLRHVERRHAHLTQSTQTAAPYGGVMSAPPPAPVPTPATRPPETKPRTTTNAPRMTGSHGSIVLARLAPLEVAQTTTDHSVPREADATHIPRPHRHRQKLVVALIGLLICGVLALLAAAAITLFSDHEDTPPPRSDEEPYTVVVQAPPNADTVPGPEMRPPAETEPLVPLAVPVPPPQPESPEDALRALIGEAKRDTSRKEALRPQALALVAALAAQPPTQAAASAETLRQAAETWRMPEAWLALAALDKDENLRLEHYLQAATLGNRHARTLAGRLLLKQGLSSGHRGVIQQAVAQLSAAVVAGDPDAMLALGEAMYNGKGVTLNRTEGRALVEQAAKLGHEPAREWLKTHK